MNNNRQIESISIKELREKLEVTAINIQTLEGTLSEIQRLLDENDKNIDQNSQPIKEHNSKMKKLIEELRESISEHFFVEGNQMSNNKNFFKKLLKVSKPTNLEQDKAIAYQNLSTIEDYVYFLVDDSRNKPSEEAYNKAREFFSNEKGPYRSLFNHIVMSYNKGNIRISNAARPLNTLKKQREDLESQKLDIQEKLNIEKTNKRTLESMLLQYQQPNQTSQLRTNSGIKR